MRNYEHYCAPSYTEAIADVTFPWEDLDDLEADHNRQMLWEISQDFTTENPPMHILEPSDPDPEPYEAIPCDTCGETDCTNCVWKEGATC